MGPERCLDTATGWLITQRSRAPSMPVYGLKSPGNDEARHAGVWTRAFAPMDSWSCLVPATFGKARMRAQGRSCQHLAGCDGDRVHRATANPRFSQAHLHAQGRASLRPALALSVAAFVGNLREPACAGAHRPAGPRSTAAARHDRHSVISLGAGLGGISGLRRPAAVKLAP